jgi:hypothetical protein
MNSQRQNMCGYEEFSQNYQGSKMDRKTLREQMLERMDGQIERKNDQLSPLAAVSHIARGGSFESIKPRVELSAKACVDSRERVRWIQVISGALQVAIGIENSTVEKQLQMLADFTDEIFSKDITAVSHRIRENRISFAIGEALDAYHQELTDRKNGSLAASHFVHACEDILGKHWK